MKTINIKSLRTSGFRGQALDVTFGDKDTVISGDNGKGKTTCYDAFMWLINGTDSEDRLNFDLFNQFDETSAEAPLTCDVEAVFEIDGVDVKLRKEAEQVYKRNRATGEVERANDTYKYYIDGLETPATRFSQWIENNFGKGGWLKLMLNIRYWEMLDARTLRNYFADIVGEISDDDFDGEYAEVMPLIQRLGAENARKTYQKEITDLSKVELQQKAAIQAAQDALPDISKVCEAESFASQLEHEKQCLEERRAALAGQNSELIERRKSEEDAISAKREELAKTEIEYKSAQDAEERRLYAEVESARDNNATANRRRKAAEDELESLKLRLYTEQLRLDEMRNELKSIKLRTFDGNCSTCGASYVGAIRTKMLELFRTRKEADEAAIISAGQAQSNTVEQLKTAMKEAEERLNGIERVDVRAAEDAWVAFRQRKRAWIATDEYARLMGELDALEANRTEIPTNSELIELQAKVGDIDARLKEAYQVIGLRKVYEDGMKRIESMKERRSATMQEIATSTKRKTMVEAYQREYADIVRRRVNRGFENVSVEMTTVNKSGDIVDTCKLRLDGVADTCNNANRIKIGIEVAQVFQKHFGVCLPLWIDNAESITDVPEHDGQRVMLRVEKGSPLTITAKG